MIRTRSFAAGLLASLLLGGPMPGAVAQVTHVPLTDPLRLAAPVRPVKGGAAIYIVKLKAPGAATYKGEMAGFAATKPERGERLSRQAAAVQSYAEHLEQSHDRLLAQVGATGSKVYSFRYALNGFAAKLTAAQVSRLAQRADVERIWLDTEQRVQTNNSAIFLGLEDQAGGLRADLELRGEDIVVGIIDSGIAPNHPSLSDIEERIPRACRSRWARASWLGRWLCHSYRHNPPTTLVYDAPDGFRGACEAGDGFAPTDCNNTVVGARFYVDGFLFRWELDPGEFLSPKDADGHGTHIATTVAGNPVDAYLFGTRVARVAGVAPRARVAVYKACWLKPGETRASCATSDLARAIDDAVADGVDIINYSVGSLETDLTAPDDLALLNALDAGVLTVVAAGNDGPSLDTIGSPSSAPWVLTAAASTQEGELFDEAIEITAPENLAGSIAMREASFTPPLSRDEPIEEALVVVDDGQSQLDGGGTGTRRDACQPLVNDAEVDGHIALIERGGCEFQLKLQHAERAGAIGAVVYNNAGAPIVMNGDALSTSIPAVMIGTADGQRLLDRLEAGEEVRVELVKGVFVSFNENGNVVGDFSSRGPSLSDESFIKPDVSAPGLNILAGHTADVANGLRGEQFQYLSGTSQAAPEVAGVAALLLEAHPDWPPGTVKSALMTSSYQGLVREDGAAADPFDRGAGHIDPNRAIDPGLVYDSDYRDHAAYLCGLIEPPFPAEDCAALETAGYPTDSTALNLPSIGVAELITGDTVMRRVTNIGPQASFTAEVQAPLAIDVFVEPPTLVLDTGESAEFSVRFVDRGSALDLWDFGELRWYDGERSVVSPIAVRPVTLRAPPELYVSGGSGTATLPVAFGYGGEYFAGVHGLRAPFVDDVTGEVPIGFVDDDPTNNFSFRFGDGVSAHGINVPEDQLYLRVALFDENTDGEDDLDLYLFYCPNDECTQVAQSGGFTSDEEIDITLPQAGLYLALVHGFETDQVAGGPGANYSLFTWSFGTIDDVGNLAVTAPSTVTEGDRLDLEVSWSGLDPGLRYLGAVSHDTPSGLYWLTIVNVESP
jgi:subtilisin family serine protease